MANVIGAIAAFFVGLLLIWQYYCRVVDEDELRYRVARKEVQK
jgi:hypothetical protein